MIATLAPPHREPPAGTAAARRPARAAFDDVATRLRWIDLSLPLEPTPYEAGPLRVEYADHRRGGDQLGLLARVADSGSFARLAWAWVKQRLGWRALRARDFPGGIGLASERFRSLSSHHGTHLDAPWHYGPRCAGRPARTVDALPLAWCFAPGLRVDVRRRRDAAWIRLQDVRRALLRDGLAVRPGRIVLLQTGMDRWWGTPRYLSEAPGVDTTVIAWLADRGVRVIGIDAFGFDRPFGAMYRDYRRTRDARVLWPAHLAGREREYCQVEKLANLGALPGPEGFWVSCLPVRIARGGAAWVRAAAAVPVAGEGTGAGTA